MKSQSLKILSIIPFFIGVTIVVFVVRENYCDKKFNATKLNITIENLKDNWGKPDYEFVPEKKTDCRVIKYEKSIFGQYVFLSDEKDKLIVTKAFDD
jgi:hypothetical protein